MIKISHHKHKTSDMQPQMEMLVLNVRSLFLATTEWPLRMYYTEHKWLQLPLHHFSKIFNDGNVYL